MAVLSERDVKFYNDNGCFYPIPVFGEAEMILDAAFKRGEASYLRSDAAGATPEERARREDRRQTPMEDREVPLAVMTD